MTSNIKHHLTIPQPTPLGAEEGGLTFISGDGTEISLDELVELKNAQEQVLLCCEAFTAMVMEMKRIKATHGDIHGSAYSNSWSLSSREVDSVLSRLLAPVEQMQTYINRQTERLLKNEGK